MENLHLSSMMTIFWNVIQANITEVMIINNRSDKTFTFDISNNLSQGKPLSKQPAAENRKSVAQETLFNYRQHVLDPGDDMSY